jgi:ketosteroid isomerase-like protein
MGFEVWVQASPDELEDARRRFAAIAGGDTRAELERWAPDAELHSSVAGVVEGRGGVFRGRDGLVHFRRELAEAFEAYGFEPDEVRHRGSLTLMAGRFRGRGRASGLDIDVPVFWLAQRNEEEQILWAHAFGALDEALAAADEREPGD